MGWGAGGKQWKRTEADALFVGFLTVCRCCLTFRHLPSSLSSSTPTPTPTPPAVALRDHIYTVDADTANGDEIFFSKVSQTPVSSRTRCPRRAVTDSVILITCRPSAAVRTCECTWVDACGLPALLPARLPACLPVRSSRSRRSDPVKKIIQSIGERTACVIAAHRPCGGKV